MTGFDTKAFLDENRIHVEHGSIFYDRFVQVHPRELAPENEAKLVAKLQKIWSQDAPSFFESYPRGAVAQLLGSLTPVSPANQKQALKAQQDAIRYLEKNGVSEEFQQDWASRRQPFAHLVEGDAVKPTIDPAAKEFLGNGFAMYLILDEALSQRGYQKELSYYLKRGHSMEALLSDLEQPLGMSPHRLMDIAAVKGVAGVAAELGVDPNFVQEVQQLAALSGEKHFSDNMIQHWQIGRRIPELAGATIAQKIEGGKLPRLAYTIQSLRAQVGGQYEVPTAVQATEQMVAATLKRLPPVMQEALFAVGAEIAYTPEMTVEPISPGAAAHGYHMKLTHEPGDVEGIYQIFLSGKEDAEAFARVLVHEAHHLFFPQRFKGAEIKQVDNLANAGYKRLTDLKLLMDAWKIGTDNQRSAIEWKINSDYAVNGMGLEEALGGRTMDQFYDMVQHAYDRLNIHSHFFSKIAYDTAPEKFYEMISRYSELRFVRLEDNPDLLHFITPEISEIYENHYLKHIAEQLAELKQNAPIAQNDNTPLTIGNTHGGGVAIAAQLDAQQTVPMTHVAADSLLHLEEPIRSVSMPGVDAILNTTGGHSHGESHAERLATDGASSEHFR